MIETGKNRYGGIFVGDRQIGTIKSWMLETDEAVLMPADGKNGGVRKSKGFRASAREYLIREDVVGEVEIRLAHDVHGWVGRGTLAEGLTKYNPVRSKEHVVVVEGATAPKKQWRSKE